MTAGDLMGALTVGAVQGLILYTVVRLSRWPRQRAAERRRRQSERAALARGAQQRAGEARAIRLLREVQA